MSQSNILRASASARPADLAGSITKSLRTSADGSATMRSLGNDSTLNALKAAIIAAKNLHRESSKLWLHPYYTKITLDGKELDAIEFELVAVQIELERTSSHE